MAVMTLELSDDLVEKIEPFQPYIPIILELSMTNFQTQAQQTAFELLRFISGAPSPEHVMGYKISEPSQIRLRELTYLNNSGEISKQELLEFDELVKIGRIGRKLKIEATKILRGTT